jgi:hypothetical protein
VLLGSHPVEVVSWQRERDEAEVVDGGDPELPPGQFEHGPRGSPSSSVVSSPADRRGVGVLVWATPSSSSSCGDPDGVRLLRICARTDADCSGWVCRLAARVGVEHDRLPGDGEPPWLGVVHDGARAATSMS